MTSPGTRTTLRMTVVIADDDLATRRALAHIIEEQGHEAMTLPDGTDVLRLIGERPVDIVLCDERMPGTMGSEVLATVARLHPRVYRALMSCSIVSNAMIDAINRARANYLVRKPFHVEEVRELLRVAEAELRTTLRDHAGPSFVAEASPPHFAATAPRVFTVN